MSSRPVSRSAVNLILVLLLIPENVMPVLAKTLTDAETTPEALSPVQFAAKYPREPSSEAVILQEETLAQVAHNRQTPISMGTPIPPGTIAGKHQSQTWIFLPFASNPIVFCREAMQR